MSDDKGTQPPKGNGGRGRAVQGKGGRAGSGRSTARGKGRRGRGQGGRGGGRSGQRVHTPSTSSSTSSYTSSSTSSSTSSPPSGSVSFAVQQASAAPPRHSCAIRCARCNNAMGDRGEVYRIHNGALWMCDGATLHTRAARGDNGRRETQKKDRVDGAALFSRTEACSDCGAKKVGIRYWINEYRCACGEKWVSNSYKHREMDCPSCKARTPNMGYQGQGDRERLCFKFFKGQYFLDDATDVPSTVCPAKTELENNIVTRLSKDTDGAIAHTVDNVEFLAKAAARTSSGKGRGGSAVVTREPDHASFSILSELMGFQHVFEHDVQAVLAYLPLVHPRFARHLLRTPQRPHDLHVAKQTKATLERALLSCPDLVLSKYKRTPADELRECMTSVLRGRGFAQYSGVGYPKAECLYSLCNSRQAFIAIDMRCANFNTLRLFDPLLVQGYSSWDACVGALLEPGRGHELATQLKQLRQAVLGKVAPRRTKFLQKVVMHAMAEYLCTRLPFLCGRLFAFTSDELFVRTGGLEESEMRAVPREVEGHQLGSLFRCTRFTLYALEYGEALKTLEDTMQQEMPMCEALQADERGEVEGAGEEEFEDPFPVVCSGDCFHEKPYFFVRLEKRYSEVDEEEEEVFIKCVPKRYLHVAVTRVVDDGSGSIEVLARRSAHPRACLEEKAVGVEADKNSQ